MDQPTTPESPKDVEVKTDTSATSSPPPMPETPLADQPTVPPSPSMPEEHRVSFRTTLLIVFLAILAAVLLFVALKPVKKLATSNPTTPTPTTSPAHSTLALSLGTSTATAGANSQVADVTIDTQSNSVSGVQFEIAYDPTVITNVKVSAGDFFPTPLTLLNQVDSKNGKINYAVGIQPTGQGIKGSGTVAVISYTILPTQSASMTKLTFLPKTQVIQQGVLGSVLEKAIDLSIPIEGLSSTPSGKTTLPATKQ